MKPREILLIVALFVFGAYWSQAKYDISDVKFWQFGFAQDGYQLVYLKLDGSSYINHYLRTGKNKQAKLETGLNAVITKFHCSKASDRKCLEFIFLKYKDAYTVRFDLDMSAKEIELMNIPMEELEKRFELIFQKLALREIPSPIPDLNFVENDQPANLTIHISNHQGTNSNRFVGSYGCDVRLNTVDYTVQDADFYLWTSDVKIQNASNCEASSIIYFHNILASTYSIKNSLTATELPMNQLLVTEYYRWMHNFSRFPTDEAELKANSHEFIEFVLAE